MSLEDEQTAAETSFSGVVRIDGPDGVELAKAYGLAHRGEAIPNQIGTRFATASGTKSLTALAVVGLVEDGTLGSRRPHAPCSGATCRWSTTRSRSSSSWRTAPGSATTSTRTRSRN